MKKNLTTFLAGAASLWLHCSDGTSAYRSPDAGVEMGVQISLDARANTPDAGNSMPGCREKSIRTCGPCKDGTQTCYGGKWNKCDHPPVPEEICDGMDNNCDREIDEDFHTGESCPVESSGAELPGRYVCTSPRRSACQPLCTLEELCLKIPCEDGGCTCPDDPLCPDAPADEPFTCLENINIPIPSGRFSPSVVSVVSDGCILFQYPYPMGGGRYTFYNELFCSDSPLRSFSLTTSVLRVGESAEFVYLDILAPAYGRWKISMDDNFVFVPGTLGTQGWLGVLAYDLTASGLDYWQRQFIPLTENSGEGIRRVFFHGGCIFDVLASRTTEENRSLELGIAAYCPDGRVFSDVPERSVSILCDDCPGSVDLSLLSTPTGVVAYYSHQLSRIVIEREEGQDAGTGYRTEIDPPRYFLRQLDDTLQPAGEPVELDIAAERAGLVRFSLQRAGEEYVAIWYGNTLRPTMQRFSHELEPLCIPQELPISGLYGSFTLSCTERGTGCALLEDNRPDSEWGYTVRRYNQEGHPVGQEEHSASGSLITPWEEDKYLWVIGDSGPYWGIVVPAR